MACWYNEIDDNNFFLRQNVVNSQLKLYRFELGRLVHNIVVVTNSNIVIIHLGINDYFLSLGILG